jgi:hypothetical protein
VQAFISGDQCGELRAAVRKLSAVWPRLGEARMIRTLRTLKQLMAGLPDHRHYRSRVASSAAVFTDEGKVFIIISRGADRHRGRRGWNEIYLPQNLLVKRDGCFGKRLFFGVKDEFSSPSILKKTISQSGSSVWSTRPPWDTRKVTHEAAYLWLK